MTMAHPATSLLLVGVSSSMAKVIQTSDATVLASVEPVSTNDELFVECPCLFSRQHMTSHTHHH